MTEFAEVAVAPDRRARALAAVATCMGGVALARTLSDPALVEELLAACRQAVVRTLGSEPAGDASSMAGARRARD